MEVVLTEVAVMEAVEAAEAVSPEEAAVEVVEADSPVAEEAEEDTVKKKTSRIARCFYLVCCQHITWIKELVQLLFA